ncbi:MAG TPA: hypothetical protein VFF78_03880 [Anaerolineaceae bacterium]|nr:hypothetical protein [Anaerolineaceae bacterium]
MTTPKKPSQYAAVRQALAPQAVGTGATVNGTTIDVRGFEYMLANVELGAISSGAGISVTVKLQESDDGAAWADVTSATTGAVLNANQNTTKLFDLLLSARKAFIRAVATGGASGGGLAGVVFHLSRDTILPVCATVTATEIGY